jgi:hypothetical protein
MSDKSKNSHIERTFYVSRNVKPGDSVRYGNWADKPREYYLDSGSPPADLPLTLIESAVGSDYSGNLVEQSNALALKRDFPWLVEVHGGYGTSGVAYLGKRENQNDRLIEAIDSLTDYCIYDDSHHSNLEMELTDTAWSEDGRDDFKRALVKMWALDDNEYDEDKLDDSAIDRFWYACTERLRGGEDHINEQGDSIYFPIDRVIEDFRRDDRRLYDSFTWGDDPRPLIERLEELRLSALVSDDTQPTTESEHV